MMRKWKFLCALSLIVLCAMALGGCQRTKQGGNTAVLTGTWRSDTDMWGGEPAIASFFHDGTVKVYQNNNKILAEYEWKKSDQFEFDHLIILTDKERDLTYGVEFLDGRISLPITGGEGDLTALYFSSFSNKDIDTPIELPAKE